MTSNPLSHLADDALLGVLAASLKRNAANTAALLAHLAEMDARKLYLAEDYPSMYLYCVHKLHMDEDELLERILVARTARKFPSIFSAIADGRLSTAAVRLLAPHLTPASADELLTAAEHKSESEVDNLLAQRFRRT